MNAPSTCMSAGCARRSTAATTMIRSAPYAAPATRSTTVSARPVRAPSRAPEPERAPAFLRGECSGGGPSAAPCHVRGGLVPETVGTAEGDLKADLTPHRAAIAAAVARRLIGDPRMVAAIGRAGAGLTAAEEEVGAARISNRPAASVFGQLEDGAALAERNDIVDQLRLRLLLEIVGMRE